MRDKLLYAHVVAKWLGCSRPHIYKLIYDGEIIAYRIGKRGYRISEQSVLNFLERRRVMINWINTCSECPYSDYGKSPVCEYTNHFILIRRGDKFPLGCPLPEEPKNVTNKR
jgi:excisionase family DNA binding protein